MAQIQKFKVVRNHTGDRPYAEGDIREGTKADFAHLIPHVLQPLPDEAEKAEPAVENKAEPAVANKAAPRRKSK